MARKLDKDTVIFVINVGITTNDGPDEIFLENAKTAMQRIIEKKIFLRPNDEVGIILMGKKNGNHPQLDKIHTLNHIQVCTWNLVKDVKNLEPENDFFSNWPDGITGAIDLIDNEVMDSTRVTIIVLSDCFQINLEENQIQTLATSIVHKAAKLLWIGTKNLNELPPEDLNDSEKTILKFCELTEGAYKTFEETLPILRFYGTHQPKPSGQKFNLKITDIAIPIKIFVYVSGHKSVKFAKAVTKTDGSEEELVLVSKKRDLVDRKKELHSEKDANRGILYGGKFVPLTEDDRLQISNNGTERGFLLRGFIDRSQMKPEYRGGTETHIILPDEDSSSNAFHALLKAMVELNQLAIVRKVHYDGNSPTLKVLYPQIDEPGEPACFFMYDLPYSDEFCTVDHQPYEKILETVSEEQLATVDTLIDELMLIDPSIECQDQRSFEPGDLHDPDVQYDWDVLSDLALKPRDPDDYEAPPRQGDIMKILARPEYLNNDRVDLCIDKLNELFHLNEEPKSEELEPQSAEKQISQPEDFENPVEVPPKVAPVDLPPPMDVDLDNLFDDDF